MSFNRKIDHTLLKADAKEADIKKLINQAKKHQFYSVCVNPTWVKLASELLLKEPVAVCTVIGFPLGANTTEVKAFETRDAIANGADEIDMVINIGQLKAGNEAFIKEDIEAVVKVAKDKALVKVIIEASLLTNDEIVTASRLAKEAGADFVKTSTGFSTGGAKVEDVALMRATVGPEMGVKASGGIHTAKEAQSMIDAGATRLGTSASIAITEG
ncbi:deoxyribose-phosphate aldolase [Vagococcus sp. BWB3-3]|uniref:Deoxyribose-phosphate aldolase n=1 Tax=Vagococcus allomyrinae TaxID=2794353 RepID=A0A940SUH0_9ENTE|nr:deoxyribose-phosphate aldolase [Vagococcus allomyrinae]MBP1041310.1 deoxyribose-phosphate aldolase [Vagococcus allomyrinae]